MTHYRWLRALAGFGGLGMRLNSNDTLYCCLPLYHNNALTVALSSVLNAGCDAGAGQVVLGVEVLGRRDPLRRNGVHLHRRDLRAICSTSRRRTTDRKHKVRVIAGNGLRPAIWDEFTERFGIDRVCEFYARQRGQHRVRQRAQRRQDHRHLPDAGGVRGVRRGDRRPGARRQRPGAQGHATASRGCCCRKVSSFQPFDGYTDKKASEKKLVRDAFKDGDVWFNTGDLMRSQGFGHAAFTDRLGDTFRWKGENVATTEVEAAVSTDPQIEEAHGVRRRGARRRRPGRHGGHPAQGGRGVRRQGAGQGRLRAAAAATRCRCSSGSSRSWRTRRRSRARRSTCARRATAAYGEGDEERDRGPDLRAGRPRRGLCPVLRRVPRRGEGRQEAEVCGKTRVMPHNRWPKPELATNGGM